MLDRKVIEYNGAASVDDREVARHLTHHWETPTLLANIRGLGYDLQVLSLADNRSRNAGVLANSEELQIMIEYALGTPAHKHMRANDNGVRCTLTYDPEVDISQVEELIDAHFQHQTLNPLLVAAALQEGAKLSAELEKKLDKKRPRRKSDLFFR